MRNYHAPTELEQAFLRVITRGYPDLESQIEACEIAEYDPLGWCYIRVLAGRPSPIRHNAEGPELPTGHPDVPKIGTIMWTDLGGMLESIEIIEYGVGRLFRDDEAPYRLFVDAATDTPSPLQYYTNQT